MKKEVTNAKVCQFNMTGPFKNKKCFYLEPRDLGKVSDLGIVLAHLSAEAGFLNLAILANKKPNELRISCRSSKNKT